MRHFFILSATGLLVAAVSSCGGGKTETVTETVIVTDTLVKTEVVTDTVTVAAPVDSAAVFAFYAKAHASKKGKHQEKHKKQGKVEVLVDSHAPVEHHDAIAVPAPAPESSTPAAKEVIIVHDINTVYWRPDEPASFPGGEAAFDQYLNKNLQYPEEALDKKIEGTVYALMTLDEQGNITNVEFPGDQIKYGFQKEARRVLMASPRWNPAKHAGTPVKAKFALPITYDIKY
jgi:TonB family protein